MEGGMKKEFKWGIYKQKHRLHSDIRPMYKKNHNVNAPSGIKISQLNLKHVSANFL